jgi:hypothetical protein
MAIFRLAAFAVLLTACAAAQSFVISGSGVAGGILTTQGLRFEFGSGVAGGILTTQGLRFELQAEPAGRLPAFRSGFSSKSIGGISGGQNVGHRYFFDEDTKTFWGYDYLLEPGPQPDTYLLSTFELGMSALDIMTLGRYADPREWKKLPLAAYPKPQKVDVGDTVSIEIWNDATTGQKVFDRIHIAGPAPSNLASQLRSFGGTVGPRQDRMPIPTVSGTAREFSVDDAEMHLVQPRITVNGATQDAIRTGPAATGALVWFYLPHRGRFILSLSPRHELGFVKAGEVRGGAVTFTLDKDEFKLESPTPVASGSAPYILYVLHDPEWAPTSASQTSRLLVGSVAPEEIASLMRK